MKIYAVNDGRTNYAVATTSRAKAVELFNGAGVATTSYDQAKYGEMCPAGELEDYAVVEATPGVVYEAPIMMRDGDQWKVSDRVRRPALSR